MTTLNKTINGKIFKCDKCNAIHIEYKNLNFNFCKTDFDKFIDFFESLDVDTCEQTNKTSNFKRKIILPIGHNNFNVLFNKNELYEFKELITQRTEHTYLKLINNVELTDIQYVN